MGTYRHGVTNQKHARAVGMMVIFLLISVTKLIAETAIHKDTQLTPPHAPLIEHFSRSYNTEHSNNGMLKILQVNIRCFSTSKILLEHYINKHNIDIAILSETWNKDNKLTIKDWTTCILKNRNSGYGGVAILARPGLKIAPRDDFDKYDIEICWGQFMCDNTVYTIASTYIPPGDTACLHKLFQNVDDVINIINGPIIVAGDLNARSYAWENWHGTHKRNTAVAWKHGEIVEVYAIELGLTILNNGHPTRDYGEFLSAPDLTFITGTINDIIWNIQDDIPINTDHLPIVITIPENKGDRTRTAWDFKNTDWQNWYTRISDTFKNWPANDYLAADLLADNFTAKINELANEHIPTKVICKHSKAFFNDELKQLLKECKKYKALYKRRRDPHNYDVLKGAVERFINTYHKAKELWWLDTCEALRTSDTKSWRTVNKILGTSATTVQPLIKSDKSYDFDDEVIATRLEEVHVKRSQVNTNFNDNWKDSVNEHINTTIHSDMKNGNENFYNCEITKSEVKTALHSLKGKTCPGPDRIHPLMIYNAREALVTPLCSLYQRCWEQGILPGVWKQENKIFIPKADKQNYNIEKAYRALSLSSIVGKLYERIVCNRLVSVLHELDLIDPDQYAYSKGKDLNQALLQLTLDVFQGFKQGKYTGAIMIDFEGAYDAVWRQGVIYKVHKLGIRGRMLGYLNSFLSNRYTRSLVNDAKTSWFRTDIGIPQGSVVGPVLYVIFTQDLSEYIDISHVKYADDVTIWNTSACFSEIEDTLSDNMTNLLNWAYKWRQTINTAKTESICFSRGRHIDIKVAARGDYIIQVKEKRLLGITLDEGLTFTPHVELISRRVTNQLSKLTALTKGLKGANTEFQHNI